MPKSYGIGKKSKNKYIELKLPSFDEQGKPNVCLVRTPDPVAMMKAGVLDDFDTLTAAVAGKIQEIEGRSVPSPEAVQAIAQNTGQLEASLELMDKVVEFVVVEPKVTRPVLRDLKGKPVLDDRNKEIPLGPDERDDETLYTDDVDLADRMFILQFSVGGTRDLEEFRKDNPELVETLADGAGVPVPTLGDLAD